MQSRGFADRRDAEKPQLALPAQRFERGHHLIQHLPGTQRVAAAGGRDAIVQMENVDAFPPEPLQASLQRLGNGFGSRRRIGRQPYFRADESFFGL